MADETLLDAFVDVAPRGVKETEDQLTGFVSRVKKTFSELGKPIKVSVDAKAVKSLSTEIERVQNRVKNPINIRVDEQSLKRGNRELGNLGNNAYQLGQAFEDAAVGFQLNGIAGAARGAANNVAFLINNLAQAGSFNNLVGAEAAKLIPLYAGIGSVLAILVLPKLAEWVSAMNDIELTSKNAAEIITREFADAKFQVRLEIDARSAVKAVREAEDIADAISKVIERAEANNELRFQITAELDQLSRRNVLDVVGKILEDAQKSAAAAVEQVSAPVVFSDPDLMSAPVTVPANPEEIRKVKTLESAIINVRIASEQAFNQARKGIVDKGSIETALGSIDILIDRYDELAATGILSEESAKRLKENLEAVRGPLNDLNQDAETFRKAQESILKDQLEALGIFQSISAEHQFLNAVNEGRLTQEDKILFALQQQQIALEEQAEKAREIFGQNNPQVNQAIDNAEDILQEEQRIDLTTEILDIEKEIAERRKDAATDAEQEAKRRRELVEKLAEEEIRGQVRVGEAVENLDKEKARQASDAQQRLLQGRIDLLQKQDKTSQKSALGDTGTIAFSDDVQPEIERLQEELKTLRDTEAKDAARERVAELEARIVSEREEAQNRIEDLREDVESARKDEIDSLNRNADEIQKLIDQLRVFGDALLGIQGGRPLGIPEIGPDGERGGPQFLPEDDIQGIGNAQRNANAAAMEGVDFNAPTLEGLTERTNTILMTLNEGVSRLDMQARFG